MWILIAVTPWLFATPNMTTIEVAQMQVESGGKFWKVGASDDRGLWQITPVGWKAAAQEAGLPPVVYHSRLWAAAHPVVHLPMVNLATRRLVMKRWKRRSKGKVGPALRAYNCGNKGLRRKCGAGYIKKIKTAGGHW